MEQESADHAAKLVRSLQSPGFSLDKIKSAIKVLSDDSCFLPRKSTFLLDWISNILIRTADKHLPNESTEQYVALSCVKVPRPTFINF